MLAAKPRAACTASVPPATSAPGGRRQSTPKGEHPMNDQPEILYTAEATATGGREGHAPTSDGRLDVDLDVPAGGGGTGGPRGEPRPALSPGPGGLLPAPNPP